MPITPTRNSTRYIQTLNIPRHAHGTYAGVLRLSTAIYYTGDPQARIPYDSTERHGASYRVVMSPRAVQSLAMANPDVCASTACQDCWVEEEKLAMSPNWKHALSIARNLAMSGGNHFHGYRTKSMSVMRGSADRCVNCFMPFGDAPAGYHTDWKREAWPAMPDRDAQIVPYCQHCVLHNGFSYCALEGFFAHPSLVVSICDSSIYCTASFAIEHFYYNTETDTYYTTEEERDNAVFALRVEQRLASRGRAVFNYHETNPIDAHGGWPTVTPKNSLCFGVELEMEYRGDDDDDGLNEESSEAQFSLSSALGGMYGDSPAPNLGGGKYILMNDGSLADSGVELITCPYTLDYHQDKFGWDKVLSTVRTIGMSGKGTDRCGMHVHVNRKAISALTLGKMLVFVNADGNRALVQRIAQRSSDRWAKMYKKYIRQGKDVFSDKYEALHLTERTIEFRIFRGNLRPARVLKNIEFCHSVVSYCQTASMQELNVHTGYLAWLGKNRGTYPNLVKFLGETYGFKDTARKRAVAEMDL